MNTTQPNDAGPTPTPWTYRIGRYTPHSPAFGFCIEAAGKIPFVASAGMAGPNHITVVADENLPFIKTGFSAAEVEANAAFIVEACNTHAANLARIKVLESALAGAVSALENVDRHVGVLGGELAALRVARAALSPSKEATP